MLLTLYKTNDAVNVINKVLSDPTDFNINLKGDTDIVNPSLIMARLAGVDYKDYNYAHILELGRFYFIQGVTAINASLYRLDLVCDVLETYKAEIMDSKASIMRGVKSGDYVGSFETSINSEVSYLDFVGDSLTGEAIILSVLGV